MSKKMDKKEILSLLKEILLKWKGYRDSIYFQSMSDDEILVRVIEAELEDQ